MVVQHTQRHSLSIRQHLLIMLAVAVLPKELLAGVQLWANWRQGSLWRAVAAMYKDDDSVLLEHVHYNFELDVLYEGVPELSSGKRA